MNEAQIIMIIVFILIQIILVAPVFYYIKDIRKSRLSGKGAFMLVLHCFAIYAVTVATMDAYQAIPNI